MANVTMPLEKLPDAIDLSHHLSRLATARATSPLKGLQKYWGKPGIISLAGGLPHPDYFPFASIAGTALAPDSFPLESSKESSSFSWIWRLFSGHKEKTHSLHVPKYTSDPGNLNLATLLQYGMASGVSQLQEVTKEITHKVFKPAYKNYATLIHIGNTDGWAKAAMTLCNPGEGVLAGEWTYPSAMSMVLPFGIKAVPLSMDSQGIRSDELRLLLSGWDDAARGMPRPHVMYTVPIGQNPTGITVQAARKKEIYDICVEYDIIIVEDDPYYFLQYSPYVKKSERPNISDISLSDEAYISQLSPSYLKFDYQGRVIRLDSFSKTIAPGCRMGWFTCHPTFAERLERQGETTTQGPCGFGQGLVAALMLDWRYEGYIRWLRALRLQYEQRRNFFVDCIYEEFDLEIALISTGLWGGCEVYLASHKSNKNTRLRLENEKYSLGKVRSGPVFSFSPPTGGMFIWVKIHFEHHSLHNKLGDEGLEMRLWDALAQAGVLFGPGSMFSADPASGKSENPGHFRISFSNVEPQDMKKAVMIFASVLKEFFKH